jgi:hypothetical protein
LDAKGSLVLLEAVEHFGNRRRKLERVIIPLQYVNGMGEEGRPASSQSAAGASGRK